MSIGEFARALAAVAEGASPLRQAGAAATLQLRTEPAHGEAFVHLGPGGQTTPAQWELVSESLRGWAVTHAVSPSELGLRITFTFAESGPDCDFAVPLV
jgi:hypothetical protein